MTGHSTLYGLQTVLLNAPHARSLSLSHTHAWAHPHTKKHVCVCLFFIHFGTAAPILAKFGMEVDDLPT
jgi:hypothetical protein